MQNLSLNKKPFIEPEHELTHRTEFQQRNHQIIRLDGQGCFVEVLTGQFHKGKVMMNFEEYDASKPKGQRTISKVTYFIPFDKFLQLSQDCKSGKLAKLAKKEKEENQYPNAIYRDLTGTSADLLQKNNQSRTDGKSESRQLKIIPGLKADFIMQAEKGPGEKNNKGIIQPLYGNKPEYKVSVPMSGDAMKRLFLLVEYHILGYISSQYTIRSLNIIQEREDVNIVELLSKLNKVDEVCGKLNEIEKSLDKISKMSVKIGKIVSKE